MIVVTALQCNWMMNDWDITQAFVQSEIDNEIFIQLPDGRDEFCGKIVKLN